MDFTLDKNGFVRPDDTPVIIKSYWTSYQFELYERFLNMLHLTVLRAEGKTPRAMILYRAYEQVCDIHSGFAFKSRYQIKIKKREIIGSSLDARVRRFIYDSVLTERGFYPRLVDKIAEMTDAVDFLSIARNRYYEWLKNSENYEGSDV